MSVYRKLGMVCVLSVFILLLGSAEHNHSDSKGEEFVKAQLVLTVSESKRLIAKGIAEMPVVKNALKNGMVIISKGTTCTYVAEEILGKDIPHGPYVLGRTYPVKGGKRLEKKETMKEIVLVKGKLQKDLNLAQAVKKLNKQDVVIKGANALDYENRLAAGIVSGTTWGTTGTIMPYVRKANAKMVIPVGLEKEIAGDLVKMLKKLHQPAENLNWVPPSMFLFTGEIVTELEALKTLCDVDAFQVAAGGIGGAEGSVRLICHDKKQKVQKALELAQKIYGEPPFVK